MSIDPLNLGSAPDDGTGQDLRSGGQIINDNFAELDTRTAAAQAAADAAERTLVAGDNILIDRSDPDHPVISASGGGAGTVQTVAGVTPDGGGDIPTAGLTSALGLDNKVDKVAGKGLSSSDFTAAEKTKLAGVATDATKNAADAALRDRATHTGTQLAATISDLAAAVRAITLAGLSLENAAITSADSILVALGRAQGQLNQKLGLTAKAADSALLNGQNAAFYTKSMVGASASVAGASGWVPAPAAGDQAKFLRADGTWQAPGGGGSGQPVGGLVIWDISEATLPAGYIPRNGQLVTRAMWPELWALVSATALTDANWIANPLSRGKFSSGDGATTFRMPDLNGKYSDGLTPAAFLRGYGLNSAGTPGLMQLDQFQGFKMRTSVNGGSANAGALNPYFGGDATTMTLLGGAYNVATGYSTYTSGFVTDGTNGAPKVGSETRPFSSTVIWCCIGGTTAVNPGTVDIVATAAQVAAQASRIQTLEADNMVILYPGGSAQAAPVIGANTRISVPNPFPGQPILVVPEIFLTPTWGETGWDGNAGSGSVAYGIRAGQVMPNDFIIIQTGISGIYANGAITGGLLGTGTSLASGSYRLKVYKFKGPLL